ncbi:MAG: hypothetical protein KDF65_13255, partial [Anaerolineae bacterium]|nr:hypothetical protein [Anaerolineae bacterium]
METIVGLFEDEEDADEAINWLQQAGFNRQQFGVIAHNRVIEKVNKKETFQKGTIQADNKLGAAGGAAVGGLTGLLAGMTALAIPGVGPTVLAGTLVVGATTGLGTATGGLLGLL